MNKTNWSFVRISAALFSMMVLVLLSTGCAFTRTPVTVNFNPMVTNSIVGPAKASVTVGQVRDSRPVTDELVLLQKANAYGPTSGAYVTQQPVAQIYREGLAAALQANGYSPTPGATNYELRASILGFGANVINGFWTETVKPRLEVKYELVDKADGRPVWNDTFIGRDTLKASTENSALIVQLFLAAATDTVRQLLADPGFRYNFTQPVKP